MTCTAIRHIDLRQFITENRGPQRAKFELFRQCCAVHVGMSWLFSTNFSSLLRDMDMEREGKGHEICITHMLSFIFYMIHCIETIYFISMKRLFSHSSQDPREVTLTSHNTTINGSMLLRF